MLCSEGLYVPSRKQPPNTRVNPTLPPLRFGNAGYAGRWADHQHEDLPKQVRSQFPRRLDSMDQGFLLRDVFNPTVVNELAQSIAITWPEFDQRGFSNTINSQLGSLSFGERSSLIRDTL